MKIRKLLTLAALVLAGTANADEYGYFTVRNADGEATSFTAIGLKMTFADGKLVATQDGTTTTLPLEALDAMFFSDKPTTTAIESVATASDHVVVYNLSGIRVAEGSMNSLNLPKGIYIVSKNGTTTKMTVR